MICVTGAGGTVSSELIKQLHSANTRYRAAHFSNEKARAARARGVDAVTIDYAHPESLLAAFQGCDKLFLLGPPVLNQTGLELNAIKAAQAAGVRHIVKQSVMGAGEEAYSLAEVHRPVEKAIESSGLAWTFLRPNSFMQNTVTYMGKTIKAEAEFYSASGEAKISHVDVRDIAAVAAQALTYDELASQLSKVLGRRINHMSLPPSDLKHGMLADGMPDELVDRMLDLERYFREGGASCITNDIQRVTGRNPRRFAQFVRATAATGVWN